MSAQDPVFTLGRRRPRDDEQESVIMPKLKTHKGTKKRFKVSANGKVTHKKCGSSHLMSHKSGKQVRRLRKKVVLKVEAEAHRLRRALRKNIGTNPIAVEAAKQAAMADAQAEALAAAEGGPDAASTSQPHGEG